MKLEKVTEGKAKLFVPAGSTADPFHKLAFFNPAMALNRTVSARILAPALPLKEREDELLVDGLCATGARGIRYALESGFANLLFVDANPHAVKLLKRNLTLNKLQKKSKVLDLDLNRALYDLERPALVVEVDAFGSPAPFIQAATWSVLNKGIVSLTATDFAKLAGARPQACKRNYDAAPLHCSKGHEIGMRILLGRLARTAAALDKAIIPVASFYLQHAGKVIARIDESAKRADSGLNINIGFAWICPKCLESGTSTEKDWIEAEKQCLHCKVKLRWAGPLWIGRMNDSAILTAAIEVNHQMPDKTQDDAQRLLEAVLAEELLPPIFYDVHEICGNLRCRAPSFKNLQENLSANGFVSSRTHYSPTGLRTDAPMNVLAKAVKESSVS